MFAFNGFAPGSSAGIALGEGIPARLREPGTIPNMADPAFNPLADLTGEPVCQDGRTGS